MLHGRQEEWKGRDCRLPAVPGGRAAPNVRVVPLVGHVQEAACQGAVCQGVRVPLARPFSAFQDPAGRLPVAKQGRPALRRPREGGDTRRGDEKLAERELQMARDRFAAGAGDNIQVITAQTTLAQAREEKVQALALYNVARVNLYSALGEAQKFRL